MNCVESRPHEYSIADKNATAFASATFSAREGQSQIARSFCRAPLKIARSFLQPDGSIEVCVMDCSPGMLAGDHYVFDWHLKENARVALSNQSFTKVHPTENEPCRQVQRIVMESGAHCELFFQPTMLYRDAILHSHSEAHLDSSATFLLSEITCAGRQARGEYFDFTRWQSAWRVFRLQKIIWCNQSRVEPQVLHPLRIGSWNEFAVWGQFAAFDEKLDAKSAQHLVEELRDVPVEYANTSLQIGVSALEHGGVCASILGRRAHDVQCVIEKLRLQTWAFLLSA
jgi:urease accessory protein